MSSACSSSLESNLWTEAPSHSGLVSIGTHKLWMSISGPPNRHNHKTLPNELVILFSGAGDVHLSWGPVIKIISNSGQSPDSEFNQKLGVEPRILVYDRSGLGKSERGPNRLTATSAASELLTVLRSTGLVAHHQALILVAHSYGAIVAREFLHLFESEPLATSGEPESLAMPEKDTQATKCSISDSQTSPNGSSSKRIKALMLVDPSTETQHLYFPHPNPDILSLLGTLNFARVTGLREKSKLSREEWRSRAIALSQPVHVASSAEEISNYVEVCTTLARKRQLERHVLGTRPLVVICAESWKEYELLYEAGIQAGNGSLEEREGFKKLLDNWEGYDQKLKEELERLVLPPSATSTSALSYSCDSSGAASIVNADDDSPERAREKNITRRCKMVKVRDCGHNIQLIRPEVVVREVFWALEIVRQTHLGEPPDRQHEQGQGKGQQLEGNREKRAGEERGSLVKPSCKVVQRCGNGPDPREGGLK